MPSAMDAADGRWPQLLDQLQALPDDWALVAVGNNKRPYKDAWQDNPLTKAEAAAEIKAGRAKAIGVACGPLSGGLLFVDHDGISASEVLERIGAPLSTLPDTVKVTSGRDGRLQLIYRVPEEFWPSLAGRRVIKSGKQDSEGKAEQLELRWSGHQSVVIGAHPTTSGYRWIKGASPAEVAIAEAPFVLIEQLLVAPKAEPGPLFTQQQGQQLGQAVPLLDFVTRDSRELVESGGNPGSWNDDQLRLALDLKGTEAWILAQGHRPDITARDAFADHIQAARGKAKDFDERKAWHRFDGAESRNPGPGTPEDRLLSRLSYHTRAKDRPAEGRERERERPETMQAAAAVPELQRVPLFDKPTKLEAGELLAILRHQARDGVIRYNRFSQQIEMRGEVLEGAERYYLKLAEQGYKVAKDLALDCLIQVAHENPYDPVRLYLEHVAATVPPIYIDGLATAYLRPEDACKGMAPTLYDHMLKCTLIGAVRRVFEPGCKHDSACVLMGDQGARKSSFWSALGKGFFSDALRDISSKDDLMVLHRSWIMEWAELDHIMGRKHAGQVKAFLSQGTDLFRVPYGKATEAFPRRGIIVGSTNRSTGFLVDETGNRRFWVIPTTRTETDPIDTPNLLNEVDGIWSAAVHAYRNGARNFLPAELAQEVAAENEGYVVDNPWLPAVQAWLRERMLGETITTERILCEAVQKPIERQTRGDQMAIADILRALGYERVRQMAGGQRSWKWVHCPTSDP
jgi:hypothetical protein